MAVCDCSIIILAHDGAEFTAHCLTSILRAGDRPRELFLVDNASEDRTPALIREFTPKFEDAGIRFVTWRNDENKGCSAARNDAWIKAKCKYVVLMDNDTAVCSRLWLSTFEKQMESDPRLGILGPKLIYPYKPHPIQCAGVTINRLGRIAFRGRGKPRTEPRFGEYRNMHALISACWVMRTDLRETVGYLDELFHPVQYEDLDLCLKATRKGYAVAYTPAVEMYHFEGITTASFGQKEYQKNIARNSLKFRERWHEVFSTYEDELPSEEFRWLRRDELGLTPELDLTVAE